MKKIGLGFTICFILLILIGSIILSINILDKEVIDIQQYIEAILLLISSLLVLGALLILLVIVLFRYINKVKQDDY